jgi:hypothetical protein
MNNTNNNIFNINNIRVNINTDINNFINNINNMTIKDIKKIFYREIKDVMDRDKQLAMSLIQNFEAVIANFDKKSVEIVTDLIIRAHRCNTKYIVEEKFKSCIAFFKNKPKYNQQIKIILKRYINILNSDEHKSEFGNYKSMCDIFILIQMLEIIQYDCNTYSLRKSAATYAPTCYFPKKEAASSIATSS